MEKPRYRGGYQYDNQTLQFVHTAEGYPRYRTNLTCPKIGLHKS